MGRRRDDGMKKILMSVCLLVSILIMGNVSAADIEVQINGKIISFEDSEGNVVNPQIINDRTVVPFRKIFNALGVTDDNILWNGETKTVTAKKDDLTIELQINNVTAKKTIEGNTKEITLDSAPVIMDGRTLVPLRFIAESLGKTVGWDAANKTAVIIDFDDFLNEMNQKSNQIYQFLMKDTSKMEVSITRNYTDGADSRKNNTAVVTASITENKNDGVIHQNTHVIFSGNNELMQEIASEGWADIQYENKYYDTYFTTKALTDGLKKVYGQEQLKFLYTGLKCDGKNTDTYADLLKTICEIDEKKIHTETFKELQTEFHTLLNLFKANSNGGLTTGNISSEVMEFQYFDFTKLDNVLHDSPFNRVYSLLNTQIFNFDVTQEELRYDYPKMNLTINSDSSEMTIDFVLTNEYNEKVEYVIKINK